MPWPAAWLIDHDSGSLLGSLAVSVTVVWVSSAVVLVIGDVVGGWLVPPVPQTGNGQIEQTHSGWSMNGLRLCW